MVYDIGFYYRKYYPDSTPEYTRIYGTSWTVEHIRFVDVPYWHAMGNIQLASTLEYYVTTTYPLIVDNPDITPNIKSIYTEVNRSAYWWYGEGVETTYNTKRVRGYYKITEIPPLPDPFRVTYRHLAIPALGQRTSDAAHYFIRNNGSIDYKYINPVFQYYRPVGGYSEYKFKIYDGDSIVYQTIETERPVFNIKKICPDNTCPVDCGDKICCYGDDGIAVDYYLK